AIISHAFTTLQAHRVEIYAVTENTRSRRVAERLGFHHEGTQREAYRLNERYHDLETYALLAQEWEPRGEIAFAYPLTEDAELRLLLPHYAEEIFALVEQNREHLRWMTFTEHTRGVEDIQAFVRHTLRELAEGTGHHWAIACRGRLVGIIAAGGINTHSQTVEIGYWLAKEFAGKGLMTHAGRAMLTYLFTTVGLNRLGIRCDVRNTRSRALAERLGFIYEGTKRQANKIGGEFVDMHDFGLLREEWEAKSCDRI
ncbi:MAG TPA: GNAT family protein, partial [Armatimonadota bacterium]|nr:GNAT family protein [Armatimonadota bacterium]